MLQQEFENQTGIYPDRILYDVIEREYVRQDENGRDVWENRHSSAPPTPPTRTASQSASRPRRTRRSGRWRSVTARR